MNKDVDIEERLIELETKLAYQDDTLEQLNQIVIKQQDELAILTLAMQKINDQVKQMAPSNIASIDQEAPPPHY